MNKILLLCVASLSVCASSHAQTVSAQVQPGVLETAPAIDANARQFIDDLVARYAALHSYSDVMQLRIEGAAGEPVEIADLPPDLTFRATLQWERPANIRFEGETAKGKFLALGTPTITRVIVPAYPNNYVAHPRQSPFTVIAQDGTQSELPNPNPLQFDEPLMGNGTPGSPGLGFLLEPDFWKRAQKDVRVLKFEADAVADEQACRVLNIEFLGDDGSSLMTRLFVAKSDGLMRRYENRFGSMIPGALIVETHSEVRANPALPAATWNFEAPANATPVAYFSSLDEHKYDPDLKVGAILPTFSGDALDGSPLELNAKSGVATIVYFFTMNSGVYDVQILNKLARIAGPDNLKVVGVSGDGLRPRLEEFAKRYRLNFPIYFDPSGRKNALAQKFGVKAWAQTFVFGADGTLQWVGNRPDEVETWNHIRASVPALGRDDFILQDDEIINPQ